MKYFKTKHLILSLVILGLIVSIGNGFKADTAVLSAQDGGNQSVYYRMYQPIRTWRVCGNWRIILLNSINPINGVKKVEKDQTPQEDTVKDEKPSTPVEDSSSPIVEQPQDDTVDTSKPTEDPQQATELSYEQNRMLELINEERSKIGANPLIFDEELARVANIKAQDMVDNNYFDHNSPTYGSPFDMMKSFGIRYYAAGENLAGYNNVEKAHVGLMNSDGHRKNILNTNFTHVGIGVCKSPRYGYVFVQMFIGK